MGDALPPRPPVPVRQVMKWTLPWIAVLVGLLVYGAFGSGTSIPYDIYTWVRRLCAVGLAGLGVAGLAYALEWTDKSKGQPWFTIPLLVSLVLFWGVFPPTWFFTEYYLFDQRRLQWPPELREALVAAGTDKKAAADLVAGHLAAVKVYADLASKIWLAVGAALGTAIGFANR